MKYYGRAEEVAQKILDAFKTGDIPKALAPIFIQRKDGVPAAPGVGAINSSAS